jgi:hypothetical protein
MAGVHRKSDAGPDANFQDSFTGLDIEVSYGGFTSLVEHFAEDFIVNAGVRRVNPLDLMQIHVTSTRA